jgi:beta-lactamase regulating signal transducer with metallopeptidase domain
VRKETFFNSNRWFLLIGLLTSVVMPLFFFKKVIFVEKPTLSAVDFATISQQASSTVQEIQTSAPIDWFQIVAIGYGIIVAVLLVKIIANLVSLFQLLNKQQIIKREQFALIDLNENVAPFSFFNYIVFNSSLYSDEELQSILLHEKVHSQQKHSIDILIAKLFCTVFWFNPFVWLYKKAITQNLEYIADQKAIQLIADKKAYQKALLKVVSHQNCLSITNHFYQSLIKKRIVMLNKNQSNKRSSWKYALVIPALIAFVFLFQIKVVAQEKSAKNASYAVSAIAVDYSTDKNATNEEMKNDTKTVKEQLGIDYKFSNVKRNDKGEIIAIKIEYKTKEGKSGKIELDSDNPIETIYFNADGDKVGFSKNGFQNSSDENSKQVSISYDDAINSVGENNENAATAILVEAQFSENDIYNPIDAIKNNKEINAKKALILFDGNEISYQDLDKIDIKTISSSGSTVASHAVKKYGDKGKNGVLFINTKKYNSEHNPYLREMYEKENNKSSKKDDFPNPPKPPTPLTAPSVLPITNEKELKKFEGLTNDVEHSMEDNRKDAIENRKALLMKRKEALQNKIFINQEKSDYKQSVKI